MTYVVAEIGQNHQGDVETCKRLVEVAAQPIFDHAYNRELPGVDAIKLQKRDMEWELSQDAYSQPYDSEHSFGDTYGEHREALELSYEEHAEIHRHAKERGLDVVETLCHPNCVGEMLDHFTPDYLKVASRDLTNHPLLEAMAETGVPMIVSTGMADPEDLDRALDVITNHHDNVSILHCLSQYPADYDLLNLRTIPWLKERYPYRIGYSDHSRGIVAPAVAVAMGAEVIEKHITLSHAMKGSDHAASLEPDGLWRMVRDIRNMERAMGSYGMERDAAAEPARKKLERSVATRKHLPAGTRLTEDDLTPISPGTGIAWPEREKVVGKWTINDLDGKTVLTATMAA